MVVNMKKNITVITVLLAVVLVLASLPFIVYLKVLPYAVSDERLIQFVEKTVKEYMKADLEIKKPVLKTELSPVIAFKVDEILLKKNAKTLLSIKNLDTAVSFEDVFEKCIVLKKLGLDYFYADVNKLMTLGGAQPQQQQPQKIDWWVNWFESQLYVKKAVIIYNLDAHTHIKVDAHDMEITSSINPKYVHFDINTYIQKDNKTITLAIKDNNKVYTKNRKIHVDDCVLKVNKSNVFINFVMDEKARFNLKVFSDRFDIKNVVELIQTNLVIPNGAEMLAFFKDMGGNFDFDINMTNKTLKGNVKLNKGYLKIVPVANLPVTVNSGNIEINEKEILLKDFNGYYGKNKRNTAKLNGVIKDYTKSVDTNIEITGIATNELTQDYISKLAGCKLTLTGDSGTKLLVKSIYNKIDITWLFKIAKGSDILIEGASLSPVNYDRALKADFHFENNILNIKNINYYIASVLDKNSKGVKPILTVHGNVSDIDKGGVIKDLGFEIPKPLPSEFLNVLIGKKVFRKGTIYGNMYFINSEKAPRLEGKLGMEKVRIPSQRLFVRKGSFSADKHTIYLNAEGKFKKSKYSFNGKLKNELLLPIVVKDVNLSIDKIDVDRILHAMNQQNTAAVKNNTSKEELEKNFDKDTENDTSTDDTYTFDTGLIIIERCIFHLEQGFYKEIKFGNLYANLTLDDKGILQIKSNKFDFAEGISTLKIFCDLKKHKYFIRLGVKDINSDLIATTLLALKKEISGKAMGLIELYTDDSLALNGRIQFDISHGTIQKVGLVQYALNFAALFRNPMAMISPSTLIDLVNIPEGNFDKIKGDLVIKNNVVEKILIKSSAPQLSSFIIGRYDLLTGDASLRIYTKFSNKNKGVAGFLRNISLNSLANRVSLGSRNDSLYYSAELAQLPPLEADEKDCQVFLTKVDGDVQNFNFISSLKKIK